MKVQEYQTQILNRIIWSNWEILKSKRSVIRRTKTKRRVRRMSK